MQKTGIIQKYFLYIVLTLATLLSLEAVKTFVKDVRSFLTTEQILNLNTGNIHDHMIVNTDTVKWALPSLLGFYLLFRLFDRYLKRPRLYLVGYFVLALLAGKVYSLFTLVLFLVASLGLGHLILERFFRGLCKFDQFFLYVFVGVCGNGYLSWVMSHFPINFHYVYFAITATEVFVFRRVLKSWLSVLIEKMRAPWIAQGEKFVIWYGLFLFVYVLVPMYTADELGRHLYFPKYVSLFQIADLHPTRNYHALETYVHSNGTFIFNFLLGGEDSIRFLIFFSFIGAFLLFESFARKVKDETAGLFTSLALVLVPFLHWPMTVPYVDGFSILCGGILLHCLHRITEDFSTKNIVTTIAFLGCTLLFKLHTISLVVPVGVFILGISIFRSIKQKSTADLKAVFFGGLIFLILLSPPLIRNYILTENPFFPVFNKIFKSPLFSTADLFETYYKISWKSLYDMTFNGFSNDYYTHYNKISIGIVFFSLILPSTILLFLPSRDRKSRLLLATIFFFGFFVWAKVSGPQFRYALGFLGFGSTFIGVSMALLLEKLNWNWAKNFTMGIVVVLSAFGFVSQILAGTNVCATTQPYPLKEAITRDFSNSLLSKHRSSQSIKDIFEYAANKYGKEANALALNNFWLYFAGFHIQSDIYNVDLRNELAHLKTTSDFRSLLVDRYKFHLIITDENNKIGGLVENGTYIREFASVGFALFRLNDELMAKVKKSD